VDIRQRNNNADEVVVSWDPRRIVSGLNFYLVKQYRNKTENEVEDYLHYHNKTRGQPYTHEFLGSSPPRRHSPPHEVRVLGAAKAPLTIKNVFYTGRDDDQPALIDWNARFSATQRAYAYRIFHQPSLEDNHGIPFEWDRSWVLRDSNPLDIEAMREAALYLTGTHDFTSFQGKSCQQASPVVTMKQIVVKSQPKASLGMADLGDIFRLETSSESDASLVTIGIVGDRFLYRQVRNMVGCLVSVGRRKLDPTIVRRIIAERNRTKAPSMAPAHGLFLVDVQHGDFVF
jgi:tRNA pseudouridine38-40 synthase